MMLKRGVIQQNVDTDEVRVRVKQGEQVESSEKNRLCLTKIMTSLPACKPLGERELNQEHSWMQKDRNK